jgi:hypothetical protein
MIHAVRSRFPKLLGCLGANWRARSVWTSLLLAVSTGAIASAADPVPAISAAPVVTTSIASANLGNSGEAAFLEDLQHRSFLYFWDTANPANGLIPDQAKADGSQPCSVSSIASVGFGLTALCIGVEHGWISREAGYARALTTLRFFAEKASGEHGFFFHFLDMKTGERAWGSELSSIDTWLFLSGVLTVRQYFHGTDVEKLATALYEQTDWPWMLDGGVTLNMGWTPETGFLKGRWEGFSEHLAMYLMAIASPTHALSAEAWKAWKRQPALTQYEGYTFLQYPPLFVHQYPHAWIDFRDQRDAFTDYWTNSKIATLAHERFCESLKERFPAYGKLWGITSSDSAKGYMDWGGPPVGTGAAFDTRIDGTVVPCASGGSIPFAPKDCIANLRRMKDEYGTKIYLKYGFVDAFNPQNGWVAANVLGIDVGITLLMTENYRTGFVWRTFMANPEIARAMKAAGFQKER